MNRFRLMILAVFISLCLSGCSLTQEEHLVKEWSDEEWELVVKEQKHRYHFQQLNDGEKENYLRMATALRRFDTEIYLEMTDEVSLYKTYNAFTNDNPDIFWMRGLKAKSLDEKTLLMTVDQPDRVEQIYWDLQLKADEIISQMPTDSDYNKVKYLYEYIIQHTDYDLAASHNQDIRSVLLNHLSVCTGYAKTFQFLAEKAGVETIFVAGRIKEIKDYGHAWNMVKLGSSYYWVDTTWGDPVFEQTFDLADMALLPDINYRFLCVPDHYFLNTHSPETRLTRHLGYIDTFNDEEVWVYPSASDSSLIYTRLNGGYFDTYNDSAITSYLRTRLTNGELNKIDFQFANDAAFQEAKEDLIEQDALGELLSLYWPRVIGQSFQYYTIEEPSMYSFSLILP